MFLGEQSRPACYHVARVWALSLSPSSSKCLGAVIHLWHVLGYCKGGAEQPPPSLQGLLEETFVPGCRGKDHISRMLCRPDCSDLHDGHICESSPLVHAFSVR